MVEFLVVILAAAAVIGYVTWKVTGHLPWTAPAADVEGLPAPPATGPAPDSNIIQLRPDDAAARRGEIPGAEHCRKKVKRRR